MMAPLSLLGSLALMSGMAMPASATFNLFLSTQVTFMSPLYFYINESAFVEIQS